MHCTLPETKMVFFVDNTGISDRSDPTVAHPHRGNFSFWILTFLLPTIILRQALVHAFLETKDALEVIWHLGIVHNVFLVNLDLVKFWNVLEI
jgi:hypothetical protein